jgi:probable 2-oxoglutarate dehydrogenase E1 component DHKTD1
MSEGTSFQPVLTEQIADPTKVERVVFLSGKMYYDLIKQRADRGLEGKITFVRIEVSSRF